jgi:hypothetical protein
MPGVPCEFRCSKIGPGSFGIPRVHSSTSWGVSRPVSPAGAACGRLTQRMVAITTPPATTITSPRSKRSEIRRRLARRTREPPNNTYRELQLWQRWMAPPSIVRTSSAACRCRDRCTRTEAHWRQAMPVTECPMQRRSGRPLTQSVQGGSGSASEFDGLARKEMPPDLQWKSS